MQSNKETPQFCFVFLVSTAHVTVRCTIAEMNLFIVLAVRLPA
jgi:hypothetical protein